MVKEMLTSKGQLPIRYGPAQEPDEKNGAAFFLLSYMGNDAVNDRAAETARIFLGIQFSAPSATIIRSTAEARAVSRIAGYFARLREQPVPQRNQQADGGRPGIVQPALRRTHHAGQSRTQTGAPPHSRSFSTAAPLVRVPTT